MYLKDNEFFVRSGSLAPGTWSLSSDMLSNGNEKIKITSITSCIIVKDEHSVSHTGVGRIAGGILGAALLGPIGALGGLLSGGKKKVDETIVHCGLDDNRSFTAESSQIGAANLVRIAQQNVRTLNTSNVQSQLTKSNTDDEMECPQCAEVIKRKAKICRFCNHIIPASTLEVSDTKNSLLVEKSAPVIKGPLPTFSNSPYAKFLYTYRRDVIDSPFETDEEVIAVLNMFVEVIKPDDNYITSSNHKKTISKRLKVTILSLEKLFVAAEPYECINKRAIKRCTMYKKTLELDNNTLKLALQIRSDIRMEIETDDLKIERPLVEKELHNRNMDSYFGLSAEVLLALSPGYATSPFYIIGETIFYVNPLVRNKVEEIKEIKKKQTSLEKRAISEEKKQADEAKQRAFTFLTPSAALAAVVGPTPLARTAVVKKLWAYVKKHKLQDETNKRMINADAKLKEIFGKPQVSMFEMASLIGEHLK